ncbi:MAG TPA: alanine--glyoxylate aminotransferase family protein [Chloroflexi bacterium]|jgi:aspartate aminotransferase-like enzyme|nr:alanine--glyoxylate aminotransferase family protein [Chloroflexota bacterium]
MRTYPIPMVPGPVMVPEEVLREYLTGYGSADLEPEFFMLYEETEKNLQELMSTSAQVVIQSGEGMIALWGALKSCLRPGDRVLSIGTGVFGDGIGDMAAAIGAEVRKISLPYNETVRDFYAIEEAVVEFKPKMITAVHCETPSGTLNPVAEIGRIKEKHGVPLFYVDAVASIGGTPVLADEWSIDLCLGGTQKAISAVPDLSFLSVSEKAWEIIEEVQYQGYDALQPFRRAVEQMYFPYTPNWHGMAALHRATQLILDEGLQQVYERHEKIALYTRQRIADCGLALFPAPDAIPSPTVTAVSVPDGVQWADLDNRFREKGLVVGGSYGPLAGKVFRLGHMGAQARWDLVQQALDVIQTVMRELKPQAEA